jgi:hypothetical protein
MPTLSILRLKHLVKSLIPRTRPVLGVYLPNRVLTRALFLDPVGSQLYRVKSDKPAIITCSGIIRVGWTFLDIDGYGPYSAFCDATFLRRAKVNYTRVVLLWEHDWSTYYHWLIDVAPKLVAAKLHFGSDVENVIFVYPRRLANYELDTIQMLGINANTVVNPRDIGPIMANQIFAVPLPGFLQIDPRVLKLREALAAPCARPTRRLYVSRSGARRIINESAVFALLKSYGFEFIADKPRPLAEQIELFGSAAYIVAPHGASLSNLVWANTGTKVLELANSGYAADHYLTLSSLLGINFDRMLCGNDRNHWSNSHKHFVVDAQPVDEYLKKNWKL